VVTWCIIFHHCTIAPLHYLLYLCRIDIKERRMKINLNATRFSVPVGTPPAR
jgi:hypothetical protein